VIIPIIDRLNNETFKMKNTIEKIISNESLLYQEAKEIIHAIAEEKINEAQITAIMVGLQIRGLQLEEILGFRQALLELCLRMELDSSSAIDLCGTGGDGKNSFNISTTTSFVLAAMGYKVIKHGNYGVSSTCGSSNVLEKLGYSFTNVQGKLESQLKKTNLCFLHAPLFHPTLMKVASIRKQLGMRTFFNVLGPLINPVQPRYQLTGTFNLELAKIFQHVLRQERKDYRILYGMDGYDELTLTDRTRVLGPSSDYCLNAKSFGLAALQPESLLGGVSIETSADLLKNIVNGKGTPAQNYVVAANAAVALQCFHPVKSIHELFEEVLEFVREGGVVKTVFINLKIK
jgi:anthranilate phosphoribosyltransferase